tara:strand:- start:44 stop:823 length:780 start_codon:yes stop_codon:yes gene_type:complete
MNLVSKSTNYLIEKFHRRKAMIYFFYGKFCRLKNLKSRYGLSFVSNFSDVTFKFYIKGKYGFYYSNLLSNITEPIIFLDIGANQGLYGILASKNENIIMSYMFEPVNKTFNLMVKNIDLNNTHKKCMPINAAISSLNGKAGIMIHNNHSGMSSLAAIESKIEKNVETVKTIDHHEIDKIIDIGDKSLYVKIDVEGHEYIVLEQLFMSIISEKIKQIFIEINETKNDMEKINKIFEVNNFKISKKIGKGNRYDLLLDRNI